MHVRPAEISDIDTLVDFTASEAEESEGSPKDLTRLEKGIRAALNDPAIARYWLLLDDNGIPAGSISALREWSDWHAGYYWWIQSMFIKAEHRGKGNSALLLDALIEKMTSEGGLALRLYVHQENERAIRAYQRLGFVSSAYQMMTLERE